MPAQALKRMSPCTSCSHTLRLGWEDPVSPLAPYISAIGGYEVWDASADASPRGYAISSHFKPFQAMIVLHDMIDHISDLLSPTFDSQESFGCFGQ